jgi:hypothetical protein
MPNPVNRRPPTADPAWLGRPAAQLPAGGHLPPNARVVSPTGQPLTGGQRVEAGRAVFARGFFFYRHVRRELASGLVKDRGYDWQAAREAADDLSNDDIDAMADKMKIAQVGGGGFLDWLLTHGPEILKLIQTLIALFSMFGSKSPKLKKFAGLGRAATGEKTRGRGSRAARTAPPPAEEVGPDAGGTTGENLEGMRRKRGS